MADNNFEGTNLLGGPFKPYVDKQVAQRQERLGKLQKDNQEIVWQNAKSAYIALASSVNIENTTYTVTEKIVGEVGSIIDTSFSDAVQNRSSAPQIATAADVAAGRTTTFEDTEVKLNDGTKRLQQLDLKESFLGNQLSNNIVLFGGTAYFEVNSSGSYSNPYYRSGLSTTNSLLNNSAYGFGGTSFGMSAMPGITSFNIKSRNMGSLREASVTIRANNEKQFQLIDSLYCRIGYSMFIEWGNSIYFNNEGKYVSNPNAEGVTSLLPIFLSGKNGDKVISDNPNQFLKLIEKRREKSNGNYDAFFGKVKNFSWEFNKAGYYEISLSLISQGDIIESLNIDGQYGGSSIIVSKNPNQPQPNETSALTSFLTTAASPSFKKTSLRGLGTSYNISTSNYKTTLVPEETTIVQTYTQANGKQTASTTFQAAGDTIDSLNYTRLESSIGKIVSSTATFKEEKPYFYIRLGDILDFIKDRLLVYTSEGDNESLLDIDTDTDKNIMYNSGINVSADPSKVIVRADLPYTKNELKTIANNTKDWNHKVRTNTIFSFTDHKIERWESKVNPNNPTESFPLHGKIMNIYFEYQYLLDAIKSLRNETTGTISLYDFVDELCQTANSCLGGVNNLTIRLEDDKIMRIYDQNPIYGTQNIKNSIINLYGINPTLDSTGSVVGRDGSFVTDFNIKTELTNDFATQVTIGAQAQSNNVGSDSTGLNSWNSGLKDRFFPAKIDSLRKDNGTKVPTTEERIDKLKAQLKYLWLGYAEGDVDADDESIPNKKRTDFYWFRNFQTKRYSEFVKLQKDWLQEIIKLENEIFNKNQVKENKQTLGTNQIGMLPINISVTIEGLSGIRIYDKLEVDTRFLPKYYPQTLIWIIKGVSHEIQNNKWYTKLETIAVPKLPTEQNFDEALGRNRLDNQLDDLLDSTTNEYEPAQSMFSTPTTLSTFAANVNAALGSSYNDSIKASVVFLAQQEQNLKGFNYNYYGVQTDQRWSGITPYINGSFNSKEGEQGQGKRTSNARWFASFKTEADGIKFVASKLNSKRWGNIETDRNTNSQAAAERYYGTWLFGNPKSPKVQELLEKDANKGNEKQELWDASLEAIQDSIPNNMNSQTTTQGSSSANIDFNSNVSFMDGDSNPFNTPAAQTSLSASNAFFNSNPN